MTAQSSAKACSETRPRGPTDLEDRSEEMAQERETGVDRDPDGLSSVRFSLLVRKDVESVASRSGVDLMICSVSRTPFPRDCDASSTKGD